jgi:hypothetical protein
VPPFLSIPRSIVRPAVSFASALIGLIWCVGTVWCVRARGAVAIGKPDGVGIIKGMVIPQIPSNAAFQAVGMLGAVIMPHNLFLHSALVQSRKVDRSEAAGGAAVKEANFYFMLESIASLSVSFCINLFVLAVFAAGFYVDGQSGDGIDVGLGNAGDVLAERFGRGARIIWAIGLLAAGQASTMTGTFAGQFVMNGQCRCSSGLVDAACRLTHGLAALWDWGCCGGRIFGAQNRPLAAYHHHPIVCCHSGARGTASVGCMWGRMERSGTRSPVRACDRRWL